MQSIEEIIRKNREAFNDNEPTTDHFDKFQKKLADYQSAVSEGWFERYNIFLKIAAAVLLFITVSTLFYNGSFSYLKNTISEQIVAADLPVEVVEVMQYYNIITDRKVSQIDQLTVSEDEATKIKQMALKELKDLESDRAELENEYSKNPNSERIINALLLNQQKRAVILDKILNVLNQIN